MRDVLVAAAGRAGLSIEGAELIRDGSNVLYRLPGGIVARIGKPGTAAVAAKEARVARWLAGRAFPAVRMIEGAPQPMIVDGRPVTWWHQLREHRPGTVVELGSTLRALHALEPPRSLELPEHDYRSFVTAYGGRDVAATNRFRLLADIQELRWTCFALSKATTRPDAADQLRHRIACLRGDVPRPWTWSAL